MRRILVVLLMAASLLPACGAKEQEPAQKLTRYLTVTEEATRAFLYQEQVKDSKVTVVGRVEDDLRVEAKLSIDGADVMEQKVSEDALAVRLIDASKVPAVQAGPIAGSMIVGDALRSGKWVLDYAGAPPLIAARTKQGAIAVGDAPMLDALYAFQYIRRAIDEAAGVELFNKDAVTYNKNEDPFPHPKKEAGVTRYDLVAPGLPRRSDRGTAAGLPGTNNFRKMAFYVKAERVIEVREDIDFESHRDFRRAREGRGPKYPLTLLAAVREGKGREPIRVRSMIYTVSSLGDSKIKISLPTDFLAANLAGAFGPQGLREAAPPPTTSGEGQPTGSETPPATDPNASPAAEGDAQPSPGASP